MSSSISRYNISTLNHPIRLNANRRKAWFPSAVGYLTALRLSQNISNYTIPPPPPTLSAPGVPVRDPRETEDCLFLDIVVPQRIFAKKSGPGAPVLVWIYGGGFTLGDKASALSSGSPATLVSRSLEEGQEGVIFLAMNYRLGLFVCNKHDGMFIANATRASWEVLLPILLPMLDS